MRLLLRIFLTGIFLYFHLVGSAQQLKVAKDFNLCLYGMIDGNGKWIVPAIYTTITPLENSNSPFFVISKGSKYGLLNRNGKEVIATIYDDLTTTYDLHTNYEAYSGDLDQLYNNINIYANGNNRSAYYYDKNSFIITKNKLKGIVDSTGKEIIPPLYYSIGPFVNGIGMFYSADTAGFLDLHGIRGYFPRKEVYNIRHDVDEFQGLGIYRISRVELVDRKFYKTYWGAYNDSGQLIVPIEFDSIGKCAGYKDIIEVYKNGKTGYFKKNGQKLFDSLYFIPKVYPKTIPKIIRYGCTAAYDGNKWGIIAITGKNLLPFIYDSIVPYYNYNYWNNASYNTTELMWQVKKGNKWGLFSRSENWILQPEYEMIYPSKFALLTGNIKYVFPVKQNKKWGAVTEGGKEMMSFIYDTLFTRYNTFIFWSKESADMLSLAGETSMIGLYYYNPIEEKKKIEDAWQAKVNAGNDSLPEPYIPDYGYFGPVENYVSDDMPFEYPKSGSIVPTNGNYEYSLKHFYHYQFGKYSDAEDELSFIPLIKTNDPDSSVLFYEILQPKRKVITNPDSIDWDEKNPPPIVMIKRPDGKIELASLENDYWHEYPGLDTTLSYIVITTSSGQGIFRSDGYLILRPGVFDLYKQFQTVNGPEFIIRVPSTNAFGVMNFNGKILIDTMWSNIIDSPTDTFWVREKIPFEKCSPSWNLFVAGENKMVFAKKDELISPMWNNKKTDIVETENGYRLFDGKTYKFASPPFPYWSPLDDPADQYFVTTFSGNCAVIDKDGKMETDTVWKKIIRLYSEASNGSYYSRENQIPNEEKFILRNKNSWGFYDTRTGFVKGDTSLELAMLEEAEKQYGNNYSSPDCPSIDSHTTGTDFKNWQRELLFDSVFLSPTYVDYRKKSNRQKNCSSTDDVDLLKKFTQKNIYDDYTRIQHALILKTDSALIFEREVGTAESQYYGRNYNQKWHPYYFNILLFPNGPRNMKLDSLFVGKEWQKVVENAAMNFLNLNPTIQANCSNPSMYPKIFEETFLITQDGLVIYPDWSYHEQERSQERISFTIPWSSLKPYLRKDVAGKIGVK